MSIFGKRYGANGFSAPIEQDASAECHPTMDKIKNLPAGVGVVLMGVGVAGVILPGPIGAPFVLAGGLVLAPQLFGQIHRQVNRRFPTFHRVSMEVLGRFVDDLEKRYPS